MTFLLPGICYIDIYPLGVYNVSYTKGRLSMSVNEKKCPMCAKKKERTPEEHKDLMNRLKRIEGQVRGVQNMLDNDAYCLDIITQVSAINAALNSFNRVLLNNHLHSCVAENIRSGNDEVIDELGVLLQKLIK